MSQQAKAPFKPHVKGCVTATKDADLERFLERLDLIVNAVEPLAVAIAEKLGLTIEGMHSYQTPAGAPLIDR